MTRTANRSNDNFGRVYNFEAMMAEYDTTDTTFEPMPSDEILEPIGFDDCPPPTLDDLLELPQAELELWANDLLADAGMLDADEVEVW